MGKEGGKVTTNPTQEDKRHGETIFKPESKCVCVCFPSYILKSWYVTDAAESMKTKQRTAPNSGCSHWHDTTRLK